MLQVSCQDRVLQVGLLGPVLTPLSELLGGYSCVDTIAERRVLHLLAELLVPVY